MPIWSWPASLTQFHASRKAVRLRESENLPPVISDPVIWPVPPFRSPCGTGVFVPFLRRMRPAARHQRGFSTQKDRSLLG